jgi:hypothetical protein
MGFVVNKAALGQVFSEELDFLRQFSFHWLLRTHHHLSSMACIIGPLVADVLSGLGLIQPHMTKKLNRYIYVCVRSKGYTHLPVTAATIPVNGKLQSICYNGDYEEFYILG